MKRLLLVLALFPACVSRSAAVDPRGLAYPDAPRADCVETLHGIPVADPYRPLEEPDAPPSRAWIDAENAVTFAWLAEVKDRPRLLERLTKLWNYERWGVPRRKGGRLFVTKNDGLQNQAVLYVLDDDGAEPRVLLDPNALSKDGTVALADWEPSRDGKLLAYSLAAAGSDWNEWRVRDVATAKDLPDVLRWVKFSDVSWAPDGSGFHYSRYDEPKPGAELQEANYFQKLCWHRLGTPQSADPVVYERSDHKDWGFHAERTQDGRWLVVHVSQGTDRRNRVYVADLSDPAKSTPRPLVDELEAQYRFLDNDGSVLWFQTDKDAAKGRVVAIDLEHPGPAAWKTIVPESAQKLDHASVVGNRFLCAYLEDAHSSVKSYTLDGRDEREVPLPGLGTARGFVGRRGDADTFFAFTSFTTAPSVWRYDVANGRAEPFRQAKTAFEATDFVTEQVFFPSRDGTRIPMFLTHRKDAPKDGSRPAYLYGYGGFSASMTPSFSAFTCLWLEMGGTYAVANLRGGGEYGEDWHRAGMKGNKQNVFDDFIAAAQWLVAERWTSPNRLAIAGGSNGGLLVGACEVQRPDLFGACLPGVGVLDMLRFHKFTIGWAWQAEYGRPDDPEDFLHLRRYSPYHNVVPACYPATFITTADHDDRVVPAHSFKFAAALQAAQRCANPILLRVQTRAGHGAGKPTVKILEEQADAAAFLVRALKIDLPADFAKP